MDKVQLSGKAFAFPGHTPYETASVVGRSIRRLGRKWHFDESVAVGLRRVDGSHDFRYTFFHIRPAVGAQDDECNFALRKVLLIFKILVSSYHEVEISRLGRFQQIAVFQPFPFKLFRSPDHVRGKEAPEWVGYIVIEQNAHYGGLVLRRRE
jgi:hypothetical protein